MHAVTSLAGGCPPILALAAPSATGGSARSYRPLLLPSATALPVACVACEGLAVKRRAGACRPTGGLGACRPTPPPTPPTPATPPALRPASGVRGLGGGVGGPDVEGVACDALHIARRRSTAYSTCCCSSCSCLVVRASDSSGACLCVALAELALRLA